MKEAEVTRLLDPPRKQVWRAWTGPDRFAQWFGTPSYTAPPSTVSMDVRAGGAWSATMVHESDGSELPFRGTYSEVAEPERLVLTYEDVNDPSNENVEVATVTFTDIDGKTEVVYRQTGHLPDDQYPQIEQGVSGFFDRLAEHLARS